MSQVVYVVDTLAVVNGEIVLIALPDIRLALKVVLKVKLPLFFEQV